MVYEPNNNPLKMEQYKLMDSTQSNSYSLPNLITITLNRIGFLLSAPFPEYELTNTAAVKRSLRYIESLLYPFLRDDETYQKAIAPIKDKLKGKPRTDEEYHEALATWTDLLITRLNHVDLLPQKKKEFYFDSEEELVGEVEF